ncbi:hypothetical protein E2493_15925 [Sphingomonas parva]|uniref:DUF4105 domain-containing protein n=1 Tax=Sphingomonas parva TaxID=2555898 RepID=A0A4Y8ZMI1_9SPHN|nr:hypothetical protein [Sphingomonas parva]TFI57200.1 hypothetical protein E2493_15925 [Sphingomonas parva]
MLLALVLGAAPAAAVDITFYSKELGSSFPHAFVIMKGQLDRDGSRIEEDYGFTAKAVTPAILFGAVKGEVISDHTDSYVKGSDKHFTVTLSDEEYDRVMAVIERWRTARQPSYSLDKANCIHFVGEIASAIGMDGAPRKGLMKKPRSFLEAITEANRTLIAARGGTFHRTHAP